MQNLVLFLAQSLATYPDEVRVNTVEGEAVVMFELKVHKDDVPRIIGTNGRNIRSIRQLLTVAGGRRKVVLELIDADEASGTEE